MADVTNSETSNGGDAAAGSDAAATPLTPQQRDDQTIARAFGSPQAQDAAPDAAPDAAATGGAPGEGSAAESAATDDGSSSSDSDEGGDAATGDGDAATADAEATVESLSDEQLNALIEALADIDEDRLLGTPALREKLQKRIEAESERRATEAQRQATLQQEASNLIAAGRKSAQAVVDALTRARQELEKANNGEDFDLNAIQPQEVVKHFQSYGAAVAQVIRQGYDNSYIAAYTTAVEASGEPMTKEEQQAVGKIAARANEILADEKGGQDAANTYFYSETMKLIVQRAKAAGVREAEAESKKKRDAAKVIVDSNLLPAAAAKAAKAKAAMPPKPTDATPDAPQNAPTMEAYRAAKAAGNIPLAEEIRQRMELLAGQRITGR